MGRGGLRRWTEYEKNRVAQSDLIFLLAYYSGYFVSVSVDRFVDLYYNNFI